MTDSLSIWFIEWLARHGTALAAGEGYDSLSMADIDSRNAIAHAHVSAQVARHWGSGFAEWMGDKKEQYSSSDPDDEYKDQFNNEVGRRIANWMENNNYTTASYTEAQLDAIMDDLIIDALNNGDLIVDWRPTEEDGDPIDSRITGQAAPTWSAPTQNWEDAAAARDYDHDIPGTETSDIFLPADWTEQFDEPTADPLAEETELPPIPGIKPFSEVGAWVPGVVDPFETAEATGSPLVLDLAGTGINLAALNGAGSVYWNITEGDFANASGWIAEGTGLLAIDLNENGIIDDHSELFGTLTTDGFTILSAYDTNTDDAITSADDDWDDLLVWTDDNADGYSQATELHSLGSLLITSINLNATTSDYDIAGNHISHESTFTIDGNTHDIVDAWFAYDTVNTTYVSDYELNPYALFLPTLRGYGNLPDLHIAMSLDGDLLDMVADIATAELSDIMDPSYDYAGKVRDVMFQWAGVQDVDPESRGGYIDARILEFLEAFMGRDFEWFGSANPGGANPIPFLMEAFQSALDEFSLRLGVQAAADQLFSDTPLYDLVTDTFDGTFVLDVQGIDDVSAGFTYADVGDSVLFWRNILSLIGATIGLDNLDSGTEDDIDDIIQADDPSNLLTYDVLVDALQNSTNQTINGDGNANLLQGGGGDDTINANGGNDIIFGDRGLDSLYGSTGNDIYIFNVGDGGAHLGHNDGIYENLSEGTDTIAFGEGIGSENVYLWTDTFGHLYINYAGVDVAKVNASTSSGASRVGEYVEQIVFADSTTWNLTTGLYLKNNGTYHYIVGSSNADTISAGINGADISAYGGNDTLISGENLDVLAGGTGDDTYQFDIGGGTTINNSDSVVEVIGEGTDTIEFGAGIDPDDVYSWTDTSGHLYINYAGTDVVKVNASTSAGASRVGEYVEEIVFEDETVWDLTTGLNLKNNGTYHYIVGSSNADTIDAGANGADISAYGGNDTLISGEDLDVLAGGTGDDTYQFDIGGGTTINNSDSVVEVIGEGADTIEFGAGIDPEEVYLWTDTSGHLYINYAGTDVVKVNASTSGGASRVGEYVEEIVFDDETVWNLTTGLNLKNNGTYHYIVGSSNADTIDGGSEGADISAYGGNDILIMNAAQPAVNGGDDDDTYLYTAGKPTITDTNGTDTLWIKGGTTVNDITFSDVSTYNTKIVITANVSEMTIVNLRHPTTDNHVETIKFDDGFEADLPSYNSWQKGTSGNDTLGGDGNANVIIGYDGADDIDAGAGNDQVHGGAGADTINGDGDNDLLHGGDGNDTLDGDAGDDILYGGDGLDTLWGDTGADTFVFMDDSAFNDVDVVKDFDISTYEDVIDIRDILSSNGYEHGVDAIIDWIEITTNGSDSDLKIDISGAGTFGGGTQIAKLEAITGLTDEAALVSSGNLLVA